LLHAVDTPAMETAIGGADPSGDGCASAPADSTSARSAAARRFRFDVVSGALMGPQSTDGYGPNGGTPSDLR